MLDGFSILHAGWQVICEYTPGLGIRVDAGRRQRLEMTPMFVPSGRVNSGAESASGRPQPFVLWTPLVGFVHFDQVGGVAPGDFAAFRL